MLKISRTFQNYLSHQLSKISKHDGRFLLLAILIIYFIPILIAFFSSHYPESWNSRLVYPLVPKMLPALADMRVITAGAECIRLGYDVLIENPCDPWQRPMNYPRIWSIFASWGINQSHTIMMGFLCGLLFFILVFLIIKKLNYTEALLYGLILCSPSIMLAVERGNNDLIVFIILGVALLAMQSNYLYLNCLSLAMIMFASIIKLYPIFTILSFLRMKKQNFIFFLISTITLFGIYAIANFDSLILVSKATPRSTSLSYGGKVIFDILAHRNFAISFKWIIFFLMIFLILLISLFLIRRDDTLNKRNDLNFNQIDAFRIGSSIYIGTFFIGNNWDYRLIFLLFTIPQILLWIKIKSQISTLSFFALMGIILTTWLSRIGGKVYNLDELINWLLFFFFNYTIILTFPNWLKEKITIKNSVGLP